MSIEKPSETLSATLDRLGQYPTPSLLAIRSCASSARQLERELAAANSRLIEMGKSLEKILESHRMELAAANRQRGTLAAWHDAEGDHWTPLGESIRRLEADLAAARAVPAAQASGEYRKP